MYWIEPYITPLAFTAFVIFFVSLFTYFNYSDNISRIERNKRYNPEKDVTVAIAQERRSLRKWLAVNALITFVACNIVILVLSLIAAPDTTKRYGTYETAASNFGLQANVEYPLAIGDTTFGGTDGNIVGYRGFFSARTIADLRPATAVNLSFSYEDKSWITTISTEIITFHINNDKAPSMSVEFAYKAYGTLSTWDNETTGTIAISNGELGYVQQFVRPDISLTDAGIRDGLAPVVNQGVSHVDITVTQDLYNQIANLK